MSSLQFLQLMQLADSAAPIGAVAHSFGVEMLAADESLTVDDLSRFLTDYLIEAGTLEAAYCRRAFAVSRDYDEAAWLTLLREVGALKPARESRTASASLGKRFLQMAAGLSGSSVLDRADKGARAAKVDIHYCAAFGLVAGALEIDEDTAVLAYLQQNVTGIVSACQRLMPLGQSRAGGILWQLKPAIADASRASATYDSPIIGGWGANDVPCFTPMLEMASMRHPGLMTRLFIS